MTDEQFDEICRSSLAFDPGTASASTWAKIRPQKWSWLPTIPEILVCGCTCAFALLVVGLRINRNPPISAEPNPVIQVAVVHSLSRLQASSAHIPDTNQWTEDPQSLSNDYGIFNHGLR